MICIAIIASERRPKVEEVLKRLKDAEWYIVLYMEELVDAGQPTPEARTKAKAVAIPA